MTTRSAQLIADAVAVVCPACGEPQPNPNDGSEQWMAGDFAREKGKPRPCVACDVPLIVIKRNRVQFE